jgi:hypothetical protein
MRCRVQEIDIKHSSCLPVEPREAKPLRGSNPSGIAQSLCSPQISLAKMEQNSIITFVRLWLVRQNASALTHRLRSELAALSRLGVATGGLVEPGSQ